MSSITIAPPTIITGTPAVTAARTPFATMNPAACSVVIVDSVYLASSYHAVDLTSDDEEALTTATEYSFSRPTTAHSTTAPGLPPTPLSPPSTPPGTPGSAPFPKMPSRTRLADAARRSSVRRPCRRECHGASRFIQLLLDTYSKVAAVTSGDAALTYLLNHTLPPPSSVLLLIDLDHPAPADEAGTLSGEQVARFNEAEDPNDLASGANYGLRLLKLISERIEDGSLSTVVPVVMSRRRDPEVMRQALLLGALDYLVKPVSAESVRGLWLNSVRSEFLRGRSGVDGRPATVARPPVASHFDQAWLERSVVESFTPSSLRALRASFPVMTGTAAERQNTSLRSRMLEWGLSPYDLSEDDLLRCIYLVLDETLAASHLHMPTSVVQNFVLALHNSYYTGNAYHNFHHAVDVLQATYVFLNRTRLMAIGTDASAATLTPFHRALKLHDLLALVIAAIGHDIGHPGVNNHFMVTCRSPLAALYKDKAVLEHFHATALCQLLQRVGFDLARYNPGFDEAEFQQVLVQTVLATDMAAHFDYIKRLRDLHQRYTGAQAARRRSVTISQETQLADRVALCAALIKCSDISNVTRPFHVAGTWTDLLNEEMSKQRDLEQKLGYPPSIVFSPETAAKSQVGFYRGMALPLFQVVAEIFPMLSFTVINLEENIVAWERVQAEYDRRSARHSEQLDQRKRFGHSLTKNRLEDYSRSLAPLRSITVLAEADTVESPPHPAAVISTAKALATTKPTGSHSRSGSVPSIATRGTQATPELSRSSSLASHRRRS
ncbi:3',5'-cyclic-nucleotide phosphodiesterase [Tieghemiomyces parasiticus]|uniref:Phosphodiesterase n=1 Tax=Tieghemiomyces parasiticus TaxID=78921 RepID=A0A9W7ZTW2_9FUNG|nr:3',5'-cyclic-nucleotide phosphodiesterase [Tieghemiomyces parasiticus]